MRHSERLAIAAHLHVLLRRKTGRVTDTEWMAADRAYALEIVRFSRERAQSDGLPELNEWADKLEAATYQAAAAPAPRRPLAQALAPQPPDPPPVPDRYVGGIR